MTYDSKHADWIETDLIYCAIKLAKIAEWTEMSAREWRSTLPFLANFRPNELFGLMGYSAK
jgi:hypothetical protein